MVAGGADASIFLMRSRTGEETGALAAGGGEEAAGGSGVVVVFLRDSAGERAAGA